MTILVDPPSWPAHGRRWSHLVSDSSLAELHAFARRLGIPERGFEGDHYDIPEERYADAVRAGAIPVSGRELLRRLQQSGLRRPKRRGERVLGSVLDSTGSRVDTVASAREPVGIVDGVVVAVQHGRELLVLPDGEGYLLPRAAVAAIDRGATGSGVIEAAAVLLDRLLEVTWASGTSARLGYLRAVPAEPGPPHRFEAVLRWTAPEGMPRIAAADPARWLDAAQATSLLPPMIAPLVRPRGSGSAHA